jgi:transposase-like protein
MQKQQRIFSKNFKEGIVEEIESGKIKIIEVSRLYEVSLTSVYKWIYQYGKKRKKGVRMVVEKESESVKRLELEQQVRELHRLLGEKQVEIEYLNKVIEIGSEVCKCDLKKKYESKS